MSVPTYVTVIVAATTVAVVLAVTVVLLRARERAGGRAGVPEVVGVALFTWLAATAGLAIAGVYRPTSGTAIPAVPIAFIIGLGGAWIAATMIPPLRALIDQPATQPSLVALQVWRVLGISFLILLALGELPPLFALPAGLGDIAAGLAAPFVARRLQKPGGHSAGVIWNVFGLLDLVVAVGLGATANVGPVQIFHTNPSTVAMTEFPMALIPTFMVPLSMVLHFLSLRYLLSARAAPVGAVRRPGGHLEPWR
jgi:hypothetical protein